MISLVKFLESKIIENKHLLNIFNELKKAKNNKISFKDSGYGSVELDSYYNDGDEQVKIDSLYLSKDKKDVLADCDPDLNIPNGTPLFQLINDYDDWYTLEDCINDLK